MNSVALLVVDMQDAFLHAIPGAAQLLDRCCFAVEAAQLLGIRTFFTTQVPDKLGGLTDKLQALQSEPATFAKTAFSALGAPGLKEALAADDIDHLIIVGLETPICVYQTAIEATNDDFYVTLLADCIGGRRAEDRDPTLRALGQIGCHVLPAETVFYSILGDAQHPAFKDFTQLVKRHSDELRPF